MDDSIYLYLGGVNSSLTRLYLLVGQSLEFIIRAIDIDTLGLETSEYCGSLSDYLAHALGDWLLLGIYIKLNRRSIDISSAHQHNIDREFPLPDLSDLPVETLVWIDLPLLEFTRNFLSITKQILSQALDRILVVKQSEKIMQFNLILTYPDFKSAVSFPGTYQSNPDDVDKQSLLIEMGPASHEIMGIHDEIERALTEIKETLESLN